MQVPTRRFLMRIYTGPCAVAQYAQRFRDAGYTVSCEGTEHVHVWCPDLGDGGGAISAVEDAMGAAGMPEASQRRGPEPEILQTVEGAGAEWPVAPRGDAGEPESGAQPRPRTVPSRTAAEWNRFDICEAYYLFASTWHEGQGSETYGVFGRLDRIGFRPSPMLSTGSLSPDGRLILAGLIRAARASRKARVS
jgi:hypothetical protein